MKVCLLFLVILIAGCSTLKMGGNTSITLEACKSSRCESHFLIHSSKEEWLEQLVFQSEKPLLEGNTIKNTIIDGKIPMGVGFSVKNPLLVYVPVMVDAPKGTILKIIHSSEEDIKLVLKYPSGISIEPTSH